MDSLNHLSLPESSVTLNSVGCVSDVLSLHPDHIEKLCSYSDHGQASGSEFDKLWGFVKNGDDKILNARAMRFAIILKARRAR
jgi:hypothetical protein